MKRSRPWTRTALAWLASAEDLVRLVSALEGQAGPPPLAERTRRDMLAPVGRSDRRGGHYALGWDVDRGGRYYWRRGDLPGTAALLVREVDDTVWALIANGAVDDARVHGRLRRRIGAVVRRSSADRRGRRRRRPQPMTRP